MNNEGNSDILGKKIFFLYPSTVVQNEVAEELIQQEYEVYIIKDHAVMKKILKRYPDSIVFADIDERMPEKEWEAWIREVMSDPETRNAAIGIITVNGDNTLERKYINSVGVRCGYTVLKADLSSSIKQLYNILISINAKGRRKYIRATTENDTTAAINLPMNGIFINGSIKDISVAGVSCAFDNDPELTINTLVKDIQIKLQTSILKVEGIIFGSRIDGPAKIYVILFTQRINPEVRIKMRKYIQHNLQLKMDNMSK
ncbi:MAG TPA: pilus assembly protein PilZ [Treponema sp.]|nr:pilus assembly protein PilZ [Treponema sp.]